MLGAALALRLLAVGGALQMANDGADYLWQAEKLVAGDWVAAARHPYHPLTAMLIAGASFLTGGALLPAAWVVAIASGLLIVLAAHGLARRLFPDVPGAAIGAALLAAVHPRTLMLTADVQSDGPFLALFLAAGWALLAAIERGGCRRRLLLAGALTGLAYLVRPEGLFLVAALGAWLAAVALRRAPPAHARPGWTRAASGATAYLLALLLCATPYVLFIRETTGAWGLTMKPSVAASGLTRAHRLGPPPDSPIASPVVPRMAPP